MILGHIGCGPKWIIWVSPDAAFQGDSKSGGPKLVPFLIRQENAKYSWETGGRKFDLLILDGSICTKTHFLRRS